MAKPAKPARSMALGQPKKKWRLFHAKHEIRTKKLRRVNIPYESVNEYDWLPFSQPFFSLQVLLHHDSNCFR